MSFQLYYRKMDYISKLPSGIIETILCLVPIQEAGRTSILSKEWRYRWSKIPELVFDEQTFQESVGGAAELKFSQESQREGMSKRCKMFYAIFQVLLSHRDTIREFSLSMQADQSCIEIDQIVNYLSLKNKNSFQKLKLDFYSTSYLVPSSIFSMTQLATLHLSGCYINYKTLSNGLSHLTTLYVHELETTKEKLLEFLLTAPSLKNVELDIGFNDIDDSSDSTITEFFECLPAVENLYIWCRLMMYYVLKPNGVPKELTTALVRLKYLHLDYMCFLHDTKLPLLLLVIKSSPNLEKLTLTIRNYGSEEARGLFILKDHLDIWFKHLNEFEIRCLTNRKEAELDFVKLILANSPELKKVTIFLFDETDTHEELEIKRILLHSRRASPVVDITLLRYDQEEE